MAMVGQSFLGLDKAGFRLASRFASFLTLALTLTLPQISVA
jgi:hypothetical protein